MFKQQRPINRPSSKQKERLDFKFSNFQALQIPKGWDRLFVSLISVETGKTISKLGKALVKNGSCQWTETLSESIYISRDDSSKGYEECLVKLLVSSGSTRSILGEVTINMAQYTSSTASAAAVSQPLRKCSYGTTLQVKIHRVTPRSKIGDEESKNSSCQEKDQNVDHLDTDSRSHRPDTSSDSIGKPHRVDSGSTSRPLKLDSKEASESSCGTFHSSNSLDRSIGRENLSVKDASKSEEYNSPERGSIDSSLLHDHYSVDGDSPSNQLSVNPRMYSREDFRTEAAVSMSSITNVGSSKHLLEAAEDTIEELRAEAKMWERNARKLMIDLEISRKEFSDLSKKQAGLGIELSAAHAEQDGLKRVVEKLKLELQKLTTNQATRQDTIIQSESLVQVQKVLEDEIKYQQDLNDDLGQQLKRSQESNIELVSVLQELEETIEQQRIEIENLSSLKLNFTDLENSVGGNSEENRNLLVQLEQLQESEKKLEADIELLEEALRNKTDELEKERKSNSQILSQVERDYKYRVSIKEEEIASLEATLSGYVKGEHFGKNENCEDLIRETESLREKVQELEKDCHELTDENLELLFKLKDSNKTDMRKCSSFDSMSSEHPAVCRSEESEVSDPKFQISHMEEEIEKEGSKEVQNADFECSEHFAEISKQLDVGFRLLTRPWFGKSSRENETLKEFIHDLMIANTTTKMSDEYVVAYLEEFNKLLETRIAECDELLRTHEIEIKDKNDIIADAKSKVESEENAASIMKELDRKRSEVDVIEADLLLKKQETDFLVQHQRELEAELSKLQHKKSRLEQDIELESNLEVLERKRHKLEKMLTGLEEENIRSRGYAADLEAQVRQLKDEKELCLQETDTFKSVSTSLQDEIRKLKDETDIQILDLKQKSEHMEKQWMGAQEECGYLKEENKMLQVSAANFVQESMELKRENQELHDKCSALVDQLSESKKSLSDCTKKVELLEDRLLEVQSEAELTKNKFDAALQESESKVQDLTDQLAASKQSHERSMADNERILKLLASYKRSEEKLKTELSDLELKHTISDYERQQLMKEIGILKVHLQNISGLQDEISILKEELKQCRLDKDKLELAVRTISGDYEELKAEKISLSEKISIFQGAISELEECERSKLYLEEKVMQMEKDLNAKEILSVQNADLKNELTELKRANMQFQQKMYRLEEERDEWLQKARVLEENLKSMEDRNNFYKEIARAHDSHDQDPLAVSVDNMKKKQLPENEVAEGLDSNDKNRFLNESRNSGNQKFKKSGVDLVGRERYERTKSSLETELRDLKERYLEMSLKYAEVEGQREDLVMKLKATKGGKRWFS